MGENTYLPMERPDQLPHPPDGMRTAHALSLEALSFGALKRYRSLFDDRTEGHPWTHLPDEDFLLRLNAATRMPDSSELRPTKGGLLMFGYEHDICSVFPGYVLDYRRVSKAGASVERIVSLDGTWSGCIFDFWQKVQPIVTKAAAGAGGRRKHPTLSDAMEAALLNALIHAEYPGRRHVVVEQASDRITFANPGSLRVGRGRAFDGGVADPRNPELAKIFALIGACSNAGEGLELIAAASESAGVPAPVLTECADPARTQLTVFLPDAPASGGAEREDGDVPSSPGTEDGPRTSADAPAVAPSTVPLFVEEGATDEVQPPAPGPVHHAAAPRGQLGEDGAALSRALARVHDPDARAALELFRTKRRIKRAEVEELLGIGSTKAKAIVGDLVESGLIAAEGGGRSTLYRLRDA